MGGGEVPPAPSLTPLQRAAGGVRLPCICAAVKPGLPLRYRNVRREYFYFNLKNFGILEITLAFQLCGEIAASKR